MEASTSVETSTSAKPVPVVVYYDGNKGEESEESNSQEGPRSFVSTDCKTNCETCEGDRCTKCDAAYYLINGGCGRCLNGCRKCDGVDVCTTCSDGFFLQDGKCTKCSNGCVACENSLTCLTCGSGFYTDSNRSGYCAKCRKGCSTCRDQRICTTCDKDYSLDEDDKNCEKDGWSWWWLLLLLPLLLLCCIPLLLLTLCRGGSSAPKYTEMNAVSAIPPVYQQ